jgi:tetratricopeptide (TPR) repeat protein
MARRRIALSALVVLGLCACGSDPGEVVRPTALGMAAQAQRREPEPVTADVEERPAVVARRDNTSLTDIVRDGRRVWLAPRPRIFLSREIQGLEGVLSTSQAASPDRPKIMWRLAEDYVELEASTMRDIRTGYEVAKSEQIRRAAQQSAIKYFVLFTASSPRLCAEPDLQDPRRSKGCPDEVAYWLGLEYERNSQLDYARKAYLELIQNWPQSDFIPRAYLAFGDLFFDESQYDPNKLPLAEQSYREVIKYPPPDNGAWGYAQYKLALVYLAKQDPRLTEALGKAGEFCDQYGSLPGAAELRAVLPRSQIR